jgi:hypothetical protein
VFDSTKVVEVAIETDIGTWIAATFLLDRPSKETKTVRVGGELDGREVFSPGISGAEERTAAGV